MIRVVVADDHPIVREGMRRILEQAQGMEVVAEVERGEHLVALVREKHPHVVVLDITMPGPSFLELIPAIGAANPGTRTLILSGHPEKEYAVHAIRAGAAGYLDKLHAPAELVAAVRRVSEGRRYISESLAEQLAQGVVDQSSGAPHQKLSKREFEVLRLIGDGLSLKEISAKLKVNPKTVSTYRARILTKLDAKTNADLVRYTIEHGLASGVGR